jgi:hypothetical protein
MGRSNMADKIRSVREGARRVRFGDVFNSDELSRGEIELEEIAPNSNPPPDEEQVEPWGLSEDAPEEKYRLFHGRLREYLRRHGHGNQ